MTASTEIDMHVCTASIVSLFICMCNACVHMYVVVDPLPCGEVSRVASLGMSWLKYAVTFRGRQDFEEIR